jgi:phospho-N-acetylmuramoyl-pentapeptide-transferase
LLERWRMGTPIRVELPGSYQEKMGTPTMGGLMVIVPVLLVTVALNVANLLNDPLASGQAATQAIIGRSVLVPMGVMAGSPSWAG